MNVEVAVHMVSVDVKQRLKKKKKTKRKFQDAEPRSGLKRETELRCHSELDNLQVGQLQISTVGPLGAVLVAVFPPTV